MKIAFRLFVTWALVLVAVNNAQARALKEGRLYAPRLPRQTSDNVQLSYQQQLEMYDALSKVVAMVQLGLGSNLAAGLKVAQPVEPQTNLHTQPQLQQQPPLHEYQQTASIGAHINPLPAPTQHTYYAQQPQQQQYQGYPKQATYPTQQQQVHYQMIPQGQTYQYMSADGYLLQQQPNVQYVQQNEQKDEVQTGPQKQPKQNDQEQPSSPTTTPPSPTTSTVSASSKSTSPLSPAPLQPSQQLPKQPLQEKPLPQSQQPKQIQHEYPVQVQPERISQPPAKPQLPKQQVQVQQERTAQPTPKQPVQSAQKGQQKPDKQSKQYSTAYDFIAMLLKYLMGN